MKLDIDDVERRNHIGFYFQIWEKNKKKKEIDFLIKSFFI